MTVRKQYPARGYETFTDGEDTLNQSPTSYQRGGDADKSRSAAAEARRLASQGSWADSFTGGTPATERTPIASTVDGEEDQDVRYPEISQDGDPSDPPPIYTPSASTQVTSQSPVEPSSPAAGRSFPAPGPVPDNDYQLPKLGKQPPQEPWPPEKREHRERETFRSISGTYQLYDLLDLSTTSGSISVTIEVQPGDKPAVLRLATIAGSVNVRMTSGAGLFKRRVISEATRSRALKTEISSSAGSVSGDIVHGNGGSAAISTNAGSINLNIYTVGVSELDAPSNLSTTTNQGSQHIKVYSGVTNSEPIRALEAKHTVQGSGSMNIDYPTEWEGTVHVTGYGSGSIGASGRGLVVRKESSHELYGYKGSKEGRKIEIAELGSGSVKFSC